MTDRWETLPGPELISRAARWLAAGPGVVLVAVDGPRLFDITTEPHCEADSVAASLVGPLHALGRGAVHVPAAGFWRDASLRFEHGREDWESYLEWLDADALRREVLDAAVQRAAFVPSLRDTRTNRSTREPPRPLPPGAVLLVSGEFLLGRGLPWDAVIHLQTSSAQRERRIDDHLRWTLPAYDRYADVVRPAEQADVVIKSRRYLSVRGLP